MEYDTDYILHALVDELITNGKCYINGNKIVTRDVIEGYLFKSFSDKDLQDWYHSTGYEQLDFNFNYI
jgi:hypothetical protein